MTQTPKTTRQATPNTHRTDRPTEDSPRPGGSPELRAARHARRAARGELQKDPAHESHGAWLGQKHL